jgi:hypothetical protein
MIKCPRQPHHTFMIRRVSPVQGEITCRTPVCTVCGVSNPRPLSGHEWTMLIADRENFGEAGRRIESAVQDKLAADRAGMGLPS